MFFGNSADLCDRAVGVFHHAGVGGFTAVGRRREVGAVGFKEQSILRGEGGGFSLGAGILVGDRTREGNEETKVQEASRFLDSIGKAVDDAAYAAYGGYCVCRFFGRFSRMDDEGEIPSQCNPRLFLEQPKLSFDVRPIFLYVPMAIDAAFSHRDHGPAGRRFDRSLQRTNRATYVPHHRLIGPDARSEAHPRVVSETLHPQWKIVCERPDIYNGTEAFLKKRIEQRPRLYAALIQN
jgi:hypothetical protein